MLPYVWKRIWEWDEYFDAIGRKIFRPYNPVLSDGFEWLMYWDEEIAGQARNDVLSDWRETD